jgi:hypothetical protein
MLLFDFSAYVKRRDAARSVEQIRALVPHLNEPGVVIEFKRRVDSWFMLHQEIDQILKASG